MKRFRFRLDRLLKIREYHEREWEVRLANASRLCIELESEIETLAYERAATLSSPAEGSPATGAPEGGTPAGSTGIPERVFLDVDNLLARQHYVAYLDNRNRELSESLAVREIERDEVRQKLAEASRARKVLDKLKERRGDEHRRDAARHAAKFLDEVAGSSLARRRLKGEEQGG